MKTEFCPAPCSSARLAPPHWRGWTVGLALLPALLAGCQPGNEAATSASSTSTTVSAPAASDPAAAGTSASSTVASSAEHGAASAASAHAGHSASSMASSAASEASAAPAAGQEGESGGLPLTAAQATVVAVPASFKETAAYVTLRNTSTEDIVLVGVSSPAAGHSMLMQTVSSGPAAGSSASSETGPVMSGMVETPTLTVPAGGELVMAPGGDHLMMMDLKGPLEEGQAVPITLQAQGGRTLELSAVVRRP